MFVYVGVFHYMISKKLSSENVANNTIGWEEAGGG